MRIPFLVALTLLLASQALAQVPVFNPTTVKFTPSADHATNVVVGTITTPAVARYELRIYATGATQPITTSDLGKPTPQTTGCDVGEASCITVNRASVFVAIPTGAYTARVAAIGPGGEGVSADSDPFGRLSAPSAGSKPRLQ